MYTITPFDNNVAEYDRRPITEILTVHDNSTVLKITISLNVFAIGEPIDVSAPPPKIYIFPVLSITEFICLRLSGCIPLTVGIFHFKEFKLNECTIDTKLSSLVTKSRLNPPNK